MEKINALTGIRAFAALWVVLLHFRANIGIAETLNIDWLAARGYWGVDVFFVLSGFILTHTYARTFTSPEFNRNHYKLFLIKRLARIYPLHLASFLIFAGLLWYGSLSGAHVVNPDRCGWDTVAQNILLVHAWGTTPALNWNYPSWSISAEWFAYLFVFAFALRYLWNKDWKLSARIVAFSWLGVTLYAAINGEGVDMYTTTAIFRIVPEFLAGCLLYRLAQNGLLKTRPSLSLLGGIAGIALVSTLSRNFEFLILPFIGLTLMSLYHGSRIGNAIFANKTSVFLGEISYSIYLLHPLAQIAGDSIVTHLEIPETQTIATFILTGEILLTVALATVGYYLVERPSRRLIVSAAKRYFGQNVPKKRSAGLASIRQLEG